MKPNETEYNCDAKYDCEYKKTHLEHEREKLHRNILTSVSHDLKTPLSCVIGSLEIYERTKHKLSNEQKDVLIKTALQEGYRLDSFITNILDMAKLESGVVKTKPEICIIGLVIADCLMLMRQRLEECSIVVKDLSGEVKITTDGLLLSRAMSIILDNAAKYCTNQSEIIIEYEKIANEVEIRIKDNGMGISDARQEKIFSKYERFSTQDKQNAGTGLGLPICREIMKLLGGTISVSNRSDKVGAVFSLRFGSL